jgi:hypothetical protein
VPENSLLSRPLRSFLPTDADASWERGPKPCGTVRDIARPSAGDILGRLDDLSLEYSGAVGSDWLTIRKGGGASAPVAPHALFTWHFHPSGDLSMSPEDWLVFLASPAMVTALLTPDALAVFQKTGRTRAIARHILTCLRADAKTPALALRRAFALSAAAWECDLEALPDSIIATKLHVRRITEES